MIGNRHIQAWIQTPWDSRCIFLQGSISFWDPWTLASYLQMSPWGLRSMVRSQYGGGSKDRVLTPNHLSWIVRTLSDNSWRRTSMFQWTYFRRLSSQCAHLFGSWNTIFPTPCRLHASFSTFCPDPLQSYEAWCLGAECTFGACERASQKSSLRASVLSLEKRWTRKIY